MTRTYAFVQFVDLKHCFLKMNIQFPLIFVVVKHVLRNDHYRNTVLMFTPEITATLKVISATTRVTLATADVITSALKVISATTKVIWAIKEAITPTTKVILTTK